MAAAEVSADSAAEAEDAGSVQRTVMAIRYVTAGESHGVALVGILENVPAGLDIDFDFVNAELNRRMGGYGRSSRMATENDRAVFLSGVISGRTIGSPIAVQIQNADCRFDCKSACDPDMRIYRARSSTALTARATCWNARPRVARQ